MRQTHLLFIIFFTLISTMHDAKAVIFASDAITIFENGKKLPAGHIIYKQAETTQFEATSGSEIWLRQSHKTFKVEIFRLSDRFVAKKTWYEQSNNNTDYNSYLTGLSKKAMYSKIVDIPARSDSSYTTAARKGMTGGTIGTGRVLRCELTTGVITKFDDKN